MHAVKQLLLSVYCVNRPWFVQAILQVKMSERRAALICPLCGGSAITDYFRDRRRSYYQCTDCGFIFVPSEFHLSLQEQKAEYDLHDNRPDDPGYRRFLNRLCEPLRARLEPHCTGLDFGCGPGPALSVMLQEAGHEVSLFDLFYYPDNHVFNCQYDFITATETVEHLVNPGGDLDKLWEMIKVGGWLGLMTKLSTDQQAFAQWHYKNDLTHIGFFSRRSFQWLAERWQADVEFIGNDVILFYKSFSPD